MRILRPKDKGYAAALAGLQRNSAPDPAVSKTVADILAKVAAKGDAALLELARLKAGDELNVEVHEGGTITLTPLRPRPDPAAVSAAVQSTLSDYARTMRRLA